MAIEVLSLYNTRAELDQRLADFFSSGTRLAWIIDPAIQNVEVCHSPRDRQVIDSSACLDGEDVVPGFRYPVAELFKEWD